MDITLLRQELLDAATVDAVRHVDDGGQVCGECGDPFPCATRWLLIRSEFVHMKEGAHEDQP